MELFEFFSGFHGWAGYVVVTLALLACGLGLPIPEDVILISGGYLAYDSGHSPWPMAVATLLGVMLGDSASFLVGQRLGLEITRHRWFRRILTPDRMARVDALFASYGNRILFAARFMPGLRAVTFFTAGTAGVPYWKFFAYDGLAALISVPVWVLLGFHFGDPVLQWAKRFSWGVLALMLIGGGYLVYSWRKQQQPA